MATVAPITLTEADLRAAAGERSFERGAGYVRAVGELRVLGERVVASVAGTEDYQVLLVLGGELPRGECSCPYGREGFFCKHCVAVGIAVIRAGAAVTAARRGGPSAGQAAGSTLTSWLDARSRDDLYCLVVEQAVQDEEWHCRLELRAAAAAGDLAAVSDRIGRLLAAGEPGGLGQPGEPEASGCARLVREAAAAVAALVSSGYPAGAIAVAEQAIGQAGLLSRRVRDELGLVAAAAAELAASHRAACRAAPADPVVLARFLAERTIGRDQPPVVDFGDYLDLLGPAGLIRLREWFTAAWQAASPAGLAEQQALERLLRLTGDTDALVGVILSGVAGPQSRQFRIAVELELAGRAGEALSLAERGLRAAGNPDRQLADFVATRCAALGRTADALRIRRDQFAAARDLPGYRQLREAADRAADWPATRRWALGLLRADAERGPAGGGPQPSLPEPVLIDALIDDGDLTAAWQAAGGVASEAQWLRLADLVSGARPADALAVYLRQLEPFRQQTGERAYLRLARLLDSARSCHRALGTEREFGAYLADLRGECKRKRRLIAILDKHQLR